MIFLGTSMSLFENMPSALDLVVSSKFFLMRDPGGCQAMS